MKLNIRSKIILYFGGLLLTVFITVILLTGHLAEKSRRENVDSILDFLTTLFANRVDKQVCIFEMIANKGPDSLRVQTRLNLKRYSNLLREI